MKLVPAAPVGSQMSAANLADWAEAFALLSGQTFKRGDLKSAVDGLDAPRESLVESAWNILETRGKVLGPSYPFTVQDARLKAVGSLGNSGTIVYAYCAMLAYSSLEDADRLLFENLVYYILKTRFAGAAMRIGHPATGFMPSSFRDRVIRYAKISKLQEDEVGKPPLPADKDLGLDVVAWYSHVDRRGGDLHFLVQCATGQDWMTKTHDIDLIKIAPHINWGSTPVRIMCIPHSVTIDAARWMRTSREAGTLFDRSRLVNELQAAQVPDALRADIEGRILELGAA